MIINSILDNDLYKFTTSYAYMKLYPHAIGTFEFVDRNNTEYTKEQLQQIGMEITHMDSLKLTEEERKFMIDSCYYIPPCYFEWLSEEEYNIFTELSCYDGNDAIKVEICDCLRSETEYSFLVFQGVEIYYYNKNNTKYKVEWN